MKDKKGKWSLRIGLTVAVAAAVCVVVPAIALAADNASTNTAVTVNVAKNVTLSATPSITMAPDPSINGGVASADVLLQVKTNNRSGYTVTASDDTLTDGSQTFSPVSTGGVGSWPGANYFGAQAAKTYDDANIVFSSAYDGGNWVGYNGAGKSGTKALVWTGTGRTNRDEVTLTNQVQVDWTMAAASYADTIYYTAAASL